MKRVLLAFFAAIMLAAGGGCLQHQTRCGDGTGEAGCGCGHCGGLLGGRVAAGIEQSRGWRHQEPETGPAGPPTAAVAYPYYTLHGPRESFLDNPPSLGN
jgi:hypothetical protein